MSQSGNRALVMSSAAAAPVARERNAEERLPLHLALLVIGGISVLLWSLIALGVSWLMQ
ncbi:MAG: hypothetical protein U1E17_12415 [Geminicoccaceae bacterium]